MRIRIPEQTKAEARARAFARHYADLDPTRFEVEVSVSEMDSGSRFRDGSWMSLPTVSACVTIRDNLVGGRLWVQWLSRVGQEGKPGSTVFLGGRYHWTSTGKDKRIRKSMPHLYLIASVLTDK